MRRRSLLATVGTGLATTFAGCFGTPVEEDEEHLDVGGTTVPLTSTATAVEWYESGDLLVLDARSQSEWEDVRIAGSEWSPATDGRDENDPTEGLDSDTRILTYCRCPHTLAGRRGAALIEGGFTAVSALDEGLDDWVDQDHPIEGTDVAESNEQTVIPPSEYHE